ncbi:MAG: hypothetical protein HYY24_20525 [Verrucomicrobia bacterium]|nr:hypothetical protein [Verrucomicrobiota bacterium]
MITPERIRQLLDRRPFRPFRLFLSDGSKHDVPHPEFAWVFGGRVFVGMASKELSTLDGLVKELSILHVTRIEEVSPPKAKK